MMMVFVRFLYSFWEVFYCQSEAGTQPMDYGQPQDITCAEVHGVHTSRNQSSRTRDQRKRTNHTIVPKRKDTSAKVNVGIGNGRIGVAETKRS